MITIRLLGGPNDDGLTVMPCNTLPEVIELSVWDHLGFAEARRDEKLKLRMGIYKPMGFADESGYPIFRWAGFAEESKR